MRLSVVHFIERHQALGNTVRCKIILNVTRTEVGHGNSPDWLTDLRSQPFSDRLISLISLSFLLSALSLLITAMAHITAGIQPISVISRSKHNMP
jgi:hypothetical protein